jgi:amino acid adenylation domain-containing protein
LPQTNKSLEPPSFRVSPQQEELLRLPPEEPGYRSQCAVVVDDGLDVERVRTGVEAVTRRHEVLRTTFLRRPGMRVPSQAIHDELAPSFEIMRTGSLDELVQAEARFAFDLEHGPVLRAALAKSEERTLLILTSSAAVADALSLANAAREALTLARGDSADHLGEPLQYADYAEWRNELKAEDNEDAQSGRLYWHEQEQEVPGASLPPLLFGIRPDFGAEFVPHHVRVRLAPGLETAAADAGATPPELLQAVWHLLIARLTRENEIATATVLEGRTADELRDAVGAFASAAAITTRFEDETSLAEVVDQVRRARREAARRLDYRPVAASASSLPYWFVALEPPYPVEALRTAQAPFLLQLSTWQQGDAWHAELAYNSKAYSADDAGMVAGCYTHLLEGATADPSSPIDSLKLLPADERERIVHGLNQTAADLPLEPLHHAFEVQAHRMPDGVAVTDGRTAFTYRELNEQANRIANLLRDRGVGHDMPVGICMDRSFEMIASLLGILKSGAAYLPLNFEHPTARLAHQLTEAGAALALTQIALADRLAAYEGEIVAVDRDRETLEALPADDPERVSTLDGLAYVMYTSGSSGLPKGVAVTHGNVANYVAHMVQKLDPAVEACLHFAVVSAISTDLGNTSVFTALTTGGTLHLISPEASIDGDLYAAYAVEHPIDVLKIAPSHLAALLNTAEIGAILPRRWLVSGGESLSWELADRIRNHGGCRLLNHYGPTETTIGSCTFDVGTDVSAWRPATVPVGRPISNTQVYVLDGSREPVPIGSPGEICIAGAGVARGYVNRSAETKDAFVPNPFGEGRMYRTGDLARTLPDGSIEFLGRIDEQVKIRGFRVEPGEVELALAVHPAVRQAAVVALSDGQGDPRLVAYFVPTADVRGDELRSFLSERLPEFMVPSLFVPIEALPLTRNGKLDRKALPDPSAAGVSGRQTDYVEPASPLEEELAGMWREVLGVERVGVTDNFFDLGGHSLLATQVIARIRSNMGIALPLHSIFVSPTVQQLAEQVMSLRHPEAEGASEVSQLLAEVESLSDEEVEQALAEGHRSTE